MDRLNQLRGEAGGSRDSLDSSTLSEAYMTANEDNSKYFSLCEEESSFDITPIKDVSLASVAEPADKTLSEQELIDLPSIPKKSDLLDYKFGKQIEAANILSGGVDIFDDNDNSYDGDELVIDDNVVEIDNKSNSDLKLTENDGLPFPKPEEISEVENESPVESKDTEVVLQIDGKNVNAIDIGNGLYLYRKEGQEELAAVQIIDDDPTGQPSFKFLKVRENAEGNLEVYEEIEIEVPKEVPTKEEKSVEKNTLHVPLQGVSKVISDPVGNNAVELKSKSPLKEVQPTTSTNESAADSEVAEVKIDVNLNGKMTKFNETRKSPVIHSTPNKEGIPLTKTMVDLQLHPNRHLDNVKTIEVHTDSVKRVPDVQTKGKDSDDKKAETPFTENRPETSLSIDINAPELVSAEKEGPKITVVNNETNKQYSPGSEQKVKDKEMFDQKSLQITKKTDESTNEEQINNTICNESKGLKGPEAEKAKTEAVTEKCLEIETIEKSSDANKPAEIKQLITVENPVDVENLQKEVEKDVNKPAETEKLVEVNQSLKVGKPIEVVNAIEFHKPIVIKKHLPIEVKKPASVENLILEKTTKLTNVLGSMKKSDTPVVDSKAKEVLKPSMPEKIVETNFDKETKGYDRLKNSVANKSDLNVQKELVCTKIETSKQSNKVTSLSDCNLKKSTEPIIEDSTQRNVNYPDNTSSDKISQDFQDHKESLSTSKEDKRSILPHGPKNSIGNIRDSGRAKQEETEKPRIANLEKSDETTSIRNADRSKSRLEQHVKKGHNVDTSQTRHIPQPDIKDVKTDMHVKEANKETNEEKVLETTHIFVQAPTSSITKEKNPSLKKETNQFTAVVASKSSAIHENPEVDEYKNITLSNNPVHSDKVDSSKVTDRKLDKSAKDHSVQNTTLKSEPKKEISKISIVQQKPINNNHAPVPFGKWTEENRQAFLIKIKESKVPTHNTSTKQIKQPNDLNRRDVLQNIDSKRQTTNASAKLQESSSAHKINVKTEAKTFSSNAISSQEIKLPVKKEALIKIQATLTKNETKQEPVSKRQPELEVNAIDSITKKETPQRKEINNQDLIDKTIEGIINKAVAAKPQEDTKSIVQETEKTQKESTTYPLNFKVDKPPTSLDAIEMKMNELHGIPFIERPPHELPKIYNLDVKKYGKPENSKPNKTTKIPKLLPFTNKVQKPVKENIADVDSEEEIIEHEPVTGDIDLTTKNVALPVKLPMMEGVVQGVSVSSKKETIITENDFDKFARRNSITYENCITLNYEGKDPQTVVQAVIEKEPPVKKFSRNEILLAEAKVKSTQKQAYRLNHHPGKIQITSKLVPVSDDALNKNYQSKSKLQMAYHSALTAKRKMDSPITIIEDKPVKVVFMDSSSEFTPTALNVQGKELSPAKKVSPEPTDPITVNCDSLDSDLLVDTADESKSPDETKFKTKHQRKQVLTPVETPELQLIEPKDLGIEESPKKKRRIDENRVERTRNHVPKKSYLLGRANVAEEFLSTPKDLANVNPKEIISHNVIPSSHDTASAIDSLVKAAELLETQSKSLDASTNSVDSETAQSTPVKRGRGRPRKYPLPEGAIDKTKAPSPQKKTSLIDTRKSKRDSVSEESSSGDELIRENWTMGKINENIVCPICNKLFRSENVVFKHVKHCTGPSPNRSDSDKRSPRRLRQSRESDSKSQDRKSDDSENDIIKEEIPKKRKIREKSAESDANIEKDIVIKDVPIVREKKQQKHEPHREPERRKSRAPNMTALSCDICGKSFRQVSYLFKHKLQHGQEYTNKANNDTENTRSVFSCEVCKKEFRKLHHLVQHRIIHNPSIPSRSLRKGSSENEGKILKEDDTKQEESAAFRCEPCDKSFRKLHHLVEHRETHDGKNRQKHCTVSQPNTEKPAPDLPPQCDVCKKTFRKLHHLVEHKEQHVETSSEKSDDKSVKSSLSTRDIIHECSLCYMVFPNEHSLNKHSVFCQKKKRQPATKPKQSEEEQNEVELQEIVEETKEVASQDKTDVEVIPAIDIKNNPEEEADVEIVIDNTQNAMEPKVLMEMNSTPDLAEKVAKVSDKRKSKEIETKPVEPEPLPENKEANPNKIDKGNDVVAAFVPNASKTLKRVEEIITKENHAKVKDTPKRKYVKEKVPSTVTKRSKIEEVPSPKVEKGAIESSDDDDVRYMLNPNFNVEDTAERKLFMKVLSKKRNSLQIERPNSKDLVKRRTSLQYSPKTPRLKSKPTENVVPNKVPLPKITESQPVPCTDSDDSDIKYSFPKAIDKTPKRADSKSKEGDKPAIEVRKRNIVQKRKSMSGIAKRKSTGKISTIQRKNKPTEFKPIKRRSAAVEHRCDCGQLFSSAALLSRHTTLAHTPPRIRRRRSPPPEPENKPNKPTPKKTNTPKPTKSKVTRKSSVKSESSTTNSKLGAVKKTNVTKDKTPRKSVKPETASTRKTRMSVGHTGVPVPAKMKKIQAKLDKGKI